MMIEKVFAIFANPDNRCTFAILYILYLILLHLYGDGREIVSAFFSSVFISQERV